MTEVYPSVVDYDSYTNTDPSLVDTSMVQVSTEAAAPVQVEAANEDLPSEVGARAKYLKDNNPYIILLRNKQPRVSVVSHATKSLISLEVLGMKTKTSIKTDTELVPVVAYVTKDILKLLQEKEEEVAE